MFGKIDMPLSMVDIHAPGLCKILNVEYQFNSCEVLEFEWIGSTSQDVELKLQEVEFNSLQLRELPKVKPFGLNAKNS